MSIWINIHVRLDKSKGDTPYGYDNLSEMAYYLIMDEILKAQSKLFSTFLTEHLIDAVKEKGYKTTVVASEVGIGQASMSRYIKGGREMPTSVFMAICNYTGVNAQAIWNAAYVQANDPASLPEDLKRKAVNAKIAKGIGLAASHDPDKDISGGVDEEFA